MMLLSIILSLHTLVTLSTAQTTYTGCHNHSSIEYCFGPDGEESALFTYSDIASTANIVSTTDLVSTTLATTTVPASVSVSSTITAQTTAVTDCHAHETLTYCINGNGEEVQIIGEATATGELPAQYTDCHSHGDEQFCMAPDGTEVQVLAEEADTATLTDAASTVPASVSTSATTTGQTTAVTDCHAHETLTFCINGNGAEVQIIAEATATGELPAQYTDCHSHGDEQYCMAPDGSEVQVLAEDAAASDEEGDHDSETDGETEMDCHFHAGVEHCVAVGSSESSSETELNCSVTQRDYDIPLRIGTLFLILVTSAIGVFLPMLLKKLPSQSLNALAFTAVKQFGTGVILSTALIHLFTHASLMFNNECLGVLEYEGTTAAIVMAGIILAFLFEFVGHRIVHARAHRNGARDLPASEDDSITAEGANAEGKDSNPHGKGSAYVSNNLTNLGHSHGNPHDPTNPNSKLSVMVMEAGILFHSILIGLTLVVAGDSFYKTLLVVIVFHQFFEGLALGARIALLPSKFAPFWRTKIWMAIAYALITPIGMAIGIGVIHDFNGNDKSTILAIGTLDALSAGILLWVGVVDMLARDWIWDGGEMLAAPLVRTIVGIFCLLAGMIIMSLLGKWA